MRALFDFVSFFDDNNLVSVDDGREAVRNDHHGELTSHLFLVVVDRLLDCFLVDLIKSRGGFVEQQDSWLLDDCSRDGNSLLLTA